MKEMKGIAAVGRRTFGRWLALVLAVQILALSAAGVILHFVASRDLTRAIFSAHRPITSTGALLAPAALIAAAVALVFVTIVTAVGFLGFSRRVQSSLRRMDRLFRDVSAGRVAASPAVPGRRDPVEAYGDTMLAPLRERVTEIQRLVREMHKTVLSLSYKSSEPGALTRTELRGIAERLDGFCKELNSAARWFET